MYYNYMPESQFNSDLLVGFQVRMEEVLALWLKLSFYKYTLGIDPKFNPILGIQRVKVPCMYRARYISRLTL